MDDTMATDARSFGTLVKCNYKIKSWKATLPEPETFSNTVSSLVANLGGSNTMISERDRSRNAVRIRVPMKNRRGEIKGWKNVYRTLRGPRAKPNPMDHMVRTSRYTFDDATFEQWSGYKVRVQGPLALFSASIPTSVSYDPVSLQKSVDSRVYQDASKNTYDGYTQFGELLETLAMLKSPLSSLREAGHVIYNAMYKQTKRLKGKDLTEAVSGSWLEYAFGISPLINGTAELMSDLVDALNPYPSKYRKAQAFARKTISDVNQKGSYGLLSNLGQVDWERSTQELVVVNGGMWLANETSMYSRTAQLGLDSMRSIVSQAWALLPLSFAVDWFVGVGPLLDECRPVRGRILNSYRTTTQYTLQRTKCIKAYHFFVPKKGCKLKSTAETWYRRDQRVVSINPPGSIQLGPGLFSLSQGMSLAALSLAPLSKLWAHRPWPKR